MRIVHWNVTKENQPMTGVKRYEDELFRNINKVLEKEERKWIVERIRRVENKIIGSTFVSWIYKYRCKNADIVHATEETVSPVINIRRPKKFVVTCHGLIPLRYPSTIKDFTTKIQWSLIPKALRKTDRIIAISEFTKREIMRMIEIEEDKIDVVYHGVDHSRYRPMDKEECRRILGLDLDKKYILVISSNLEQKRMDIVKKVFDIIRKERDDVRLLKAGYGEKMEGEGIINVGWVAEDKIPILINSADVYFHPSEYESFGLPILEAMACGVPVVTSNKASIPEIVGSYDNTVDLSSEDYVGEFCEKILRNIDNGKDNKAIERSKRFSWEKTARETIKVYEMMIER